MSFYDKMLELKNVYNSCYKSFSSDLYKYIKINFETYINSEKFVDELERRLRLNFLMGGQFSDPLCLDIIVNRNDCHINIVNKSPQVIVNFFEGEFSNDLLYKDNSTYEEYENNVDTAKDLIKDLYNILEVKLIELGFPKDKIHFEFKNDSDYLIPNFEKDNLEHTYCHTESCEIVLEI